MNICSYEESVKADETLNALYQQKIAILSPESKTRLKTAQKAWLKFRDASCMYEIGPREDSGTIWPLLQNNCLTAFTKKRITELKSYVACTRGEDFCPL